MSKTRALFGLAMAIALPISIEAVPVTAAEVDPPPAPPAPQVAPLNATFPLLIEAGGAQIFTDSQGRAWRADDGFIGGNVADRGAIQIDGTSDDRIYQTERWGLSGYTVKVPNGKYTVRLHLAETFHSAAGKRIFSVQVEDRTIENLDVFAEAGGRNKALVKTLDEVAVTDGEMNINFVGTGAVVNGIEMSHFVPPPAVLTLTGGSIDENSAAGEPVATVQATGAPTDVFSYALSDDAGGRFAVDAQSGAITVKAGAALDFEAAVSHEVEVAATDGRGVTTKKRFTITVLDVAEGIGGLKLSHLIPEDAPAGTLVGVVAAIDPGVADPVFSLKDDAGERFAVDAETGEVRVAAGADLDAETAATHSITAVADAGSGQVIEQSFVVSLADVNEPPSVIFMSAQSVDHAAPAGTLIGAASAVDQDANETLTYSLVDDAQGRFTIDAATGAVSVAAGANLDHRAAAAHRIIVKATDSAGHSLTNGFTLTVRAPTVVPQPMFIEAGGSSDFVDSQQRTWIADAGFVGGQVTDRGGIEIAGTSDDRLYQTERWGMTGYSLPVTPGLYTVKLHFAEHFATAANARVFSVDVEGQKLGDIDVFAAAGARTALIRTVPNVAVIDGKLDIAFTKKVGGTMVNAIEVEPVLSCPTMR
jgi:hypothetical protein